MVFLVTELGAEDMLLGYPWLATYEPRISWRLATPFGDTLPIIIRSKKGNTQSEDAYPTALIKYAHTNAPTENEKKNILEELEAEAGIRSLSTDLAIVAQKDQPKVTLPPQYQQFAHLFNEEALHRLPSSKPWDHAIDLVPDAPRYMDCKVYPMTREEDLALREFLEEQQRKNYIRPSISLYASPFFFIKKKNGKLRPVQDYRKLNHITIRNMAPVPRTSEHIHDLGEARYYTKIDVRSGYNNIRIL